MQGLVDAAVAFIPGIVTGIGAVAVAAIAVKLAIVGIRKVTSAVK